MQIALIVLITAPWAFGAEPWTVFEAVREALSRSPQAAQAAIDLKRAQLEEPSLLALTDPFVGIKASVSEDRGPRSIPTIQGTYSKSNKLDLTLNQQFLTGAEAQLFFKTQKLENPSLFRPLDPTVDSQLGLEVRQPLLRYFWGRPDKAKRGQARARVQAAQARLDSAKEGAAARAVLSYVETYVAQQNIEIRQAAVQDALRLLETYKDKRRYGLIESSDLTQAEVSLRVEETELRGARSALVQAAEALRQALYREQRDPLPALTLPRAPDKPMPSPEEAAQTAWARRGDWIAAQSEIERAQYFLRVEQLSTLPDLAAFASYYGAGLDARASRSWESARSLGNPVYTAGLELTLALGQKREILRRREAELSIQSAQTQTQSLKAQINKELAGAIESLALARERRAAYEELLSLERKKLTQAQLDFQRGKASTDILIRFQSDIHRAHALLFRAQADDAIAWAEFSLACGILIENLDQIEKAGR